MVERISDLQTVVWVQATNGEVLAPDALGNTARAVWADTCAMERDWQLQLLLSVFFQS
jgi:hypothetical protein